MKKSLEKFNIIKNKKIKVDDFINRALYKPKIGYYTNKMPFGKKGDFVTSPTISNLFSEIIAIWIISTWETLGKPKIFNLVELGPGDGSLSEVLVKTFKNFPAFNNSLKFFLYEKSEFLRRIQKEKKQAAIKHKAIMNSGILTDAVSSMDGDTTVYDNSYVEFLQNNLEEPNYKPRGKKKEKDNRPVGVEKYFNSPKK